MTEIKDKNKDIVDVHTLPVLVKTSFSESRLIEMEIGSSVASILDIIAAERNCPVDALMMIREGDDAPLTDSVLIEEGYPNRRLHHVHYTGTVEVTVNYQSDSHHRDFNRNATIEDVLLWAIDKFKIDSTMATEFELARHDQKEELTTTEHVGHLAAHDQELELDLVRGDIANGFCL